MYLSVRLAPWAVSAAVMRDGGAVTLLSSLLSCVVSSYQPQCFSGDTFLMFYLRAGVETRVQQIHQTILTRNSLERGISAITEMIQV